MTTEPSYNPHRTRWAKKGDHLGLLVVGLVLETVSQILDLDFKDFQKYTIGIIQVIHGSSSSITVNLWKL